MECWGIAKAIQEDLFSEDELCDVILACRVIRKSEKEASDAMAYLEPSSGSSKGSVIISSSKDVFGMVSHYNLMMRFNKEDVSYQAFLAERSKAFRFLQNDKYHLIPPLLRKFRFNNLAITDDTLNVVASGVFPFNSLMNHSCSVQTVSTFEPRTMVSRRMNLWTKYVNSSTRS
jgi:hypothetical protein